MFLIRRAKVDDIPTLLKLAKMVAFINLPADRDVITSKVIHSRNSFLRVAAERKSRTGRKGAKQKAVIEPVPMPAAARNGQATVSGLGEVLTQSPLFMFVLEDTETGSCLGTSQVVARMGGPGSPNVSFALERREFFSTSLQTGTTQIAAKLHLDERGPSELGGLILQPSYRRHKARLGRFLSLVRFHFVGSHRSIFSERLLAEMLAPHGPDGQNALWESLGRRFIALSYTEADRFCQYSREFMLSLLPREEFYLALLPPEARRVVGEVGEETVPARRMLEKLGFETTNRIDPFDGGPHLEADTDSVDLVKQTLTARIGPPTRKKKTPNWAMVSVLEDDGEFRALETPVEVSGTGAKTIASVPRKAMDLLQVDQGNRVNLTLMDTSVWTPPVLV